MFPRTLPARSSVVAIFNRATCLRTCRSLWIATHHKTCSNSVFAWCSDGLPGKKAGSAGRQGALPRRDNDITSVGVIYGTFSRYVPRTTAETVIEANYQVTLTNWLSITPDLQYVIKPNGSSAIKNALVLGAQVQIVF